MMRKLSTFSITIILGCGLLVAIEILSTWYNRNLNKLVTSTHVETRRQSPLLSSTTTALDVGQPRCIGLGPEEEMDKLISNHQQIFIVMPAKAAGKSSKGFVDRCTPSFGKFFGTMVVTTIGKHKKRDALIEDIEPPPLIAQWLNKPSPDYLVDLAKQTTKQSLIVYIHREETDRLKSAIRQYVVKKASTSKKEWIDGITEEELLSVIQDGKQEIGNRGDRILNCQAYEAIDDNAPNLVFIHYLQVTKLLKLLAKLHCPNQEPVHKNSGSDKTPIPVILKNYYTKDDGDGYTHLSSSAAAAANATTNARMYMDDWLNAKINLLELGLNLKKEVSCQATTRKMEVDLLSCPDEALHFSSATFFRST